jgi:hypothetical protein
MPVRIDALFEHGGDHRAEIALFAQNKPERRVVRAHRAGAAAMFETVAVAARGTDRLPQHNCVTGFGHPLPPPPLFGGLARRAQSRRAEHVGQGVGIGGIGGHFGRISPKLEQNKNYFWMRAPAKSMRYLFRHGRP